MKPLTLGLCALVPLALAGGLMASASPGAALWGLLLGAAGLGFAGWLAWVLK